MKAEDYRATGETRIVMCPPRFLDNKTPNNVFMEKSQPIDRERAMTQYRRVKTAIESFGLEVLEIPEQRGAQDQTFVANIAISIDPYIVLANYKAPGRAIEVEPARGFFTNLGYDCIQPPKYFEGEADLKHWKDNIYFGGVGQFSTENAFRWIEEKTGCQIILLEENNPECFHLDCSLSVIDEENVIVNPAGLSRASIEKLKSLVNVIEQPKGTDTTGITNSVRIPGKPVVLSGTLRGEKPDYRKAVEWLAKTYDAFGIVLWPVDTDAVDPSGADLSCTVMTLTF
jgi:N-dimethylarginine dimethylaminohydrolase